MECLAARRLTNLWLNHKTSHYRVLVRTWSSQQIRSSFIDFFKGHDHEHIPSSSVIPPKGDGTYFTNAGMNQFKPIFLGTCNQTSKLWGIKRAVNSQKCIRVGGKHNDLEDVGHDLTHHTFFEMLGNWSFGDYFKREACTMAYQLLTEHYRISPDRLYFTYFGGDSKANLPADEECLDIWASIGIPRKRILPFGVRDNFWEMGVTGPCGPCTEIHFDHIGNRFAGSEVNADSPTVVEIWNLVFMEYNRQADQSLESLPARHIDTGMGLERITAVMNGTQDNYATDIFMPIFSVIKEISKCATYSGQLNKMDTSYRILADHARMFTVSISDGLLPSNDNLGHKLRGIIHKCIHLSRDDFKVDPHILLPALVRPVISTLGDAHPSLSTNETYVIDVLISSIDHYDKTLDQASRSFNKMMSKERPSRFLSGEAILSLEKGAYGSGMSVELIELLAGRKGLKLDMAGYEISLKKHKDDKPTPSPIPLSANNSMSRLVSHLVARSVPATDDSFKYALFSSDCDTNKNANNASGTPVQCLLHCLSHQGQVTQHLAEGSKGEVIMDKTVFYAESGGQEADTGILSSEGGVFQVTDVQRLGDYVIHHGRVIQGCLDTGQTVEPCVSMLQREGNMRNHTGTHLLHSAIRDVLTNTLQQGSSVTSHKMTFDFLTLSKFEGEDIEYVGNRVRECIQRRFPVQTDVVPFNSIQSIPDVTFNSKEEYPPEVRLVSVVGDKGQKPVSRELCGGTHVHNTSDLIDFCITHLGSRSQNVKRATCVTGREAEQAHWNGQMMTGICELLYHVVDSEWTKHECRDRICNLKEICELTKQRLIQRKMTISSSWSKFIGDSYTRVEEIITETEKAILVATSLSECLNATIESDDLVGLMSSLIKSINKAQQLDLLPKTSRDQAVTCLHHCEHKVSERINAKNTQLLLQQIKQAVDEQSGDVNASCIIDVSPDINQRQVIRILVKNKCHRPLIIFQESPTSQHCIVTFACESNKLQTTPKNFLSKILHELNGNVKVKGKVAADKESTVVFSMSLKRNLAREDFVSKIDCLLQGS